MHFMVSWDIRGAGNNWTTVADQLTNQLGTYLEVDPLSTVYIVKTSSESGRSAILTKLEKMAESYKQSSNITVWILASPLISGGSYSGWLPQDWWPKIQAMT